jgi:hypothetical protein
MPRDMARFGFGIMEWLIYCVSEWQTQHGMNHKTLFVDLRIYVCTLYPYTYTT